MKMIVASPNKDVYYQVVECALIELVAGIANMLCFSRSSRVGCANRA